MPTRVMRADAEEDRPVDAPTPVRVRRQSDIQRTLARPDARKKKRVLLQSSAVSFGLNTTAGERRQRNDQPSVDQHVERLSVRAELVTVSASRVCPRREMATVRARSSDEARWRDDTRFSASREEAESTWNMRLPVCVGILIKRRRAQLMKTMKANTDTARTITPRMIGWKAPWAPSSSFGDRRREFAKMTRRCQRDALRCHAR